MIRLLARWWRAAFHTPEAAFVRVAPSGVVVVPARLVLRQRPPLVRADHDGVSLVMWDGWFYVPDRATLDRILERLGCPQ